MNFDMTEPPIGERTGKGRFSTQNGFANDILNVHDGRAGGKPQPAASRWARGGGGMNSGSEVGDVLALAPFADELGE